MGFDKRLTHATTKNIKMAILLSPGPVANHLTTRSMSSSFKIAVTKPKFMAAARQLQDEGMGFLVVLDAISSSTDVFVKRSPKEMEPLIQPFSDQFTLEEYEYQYRLAPFSYINQLMQNLLVQMGYVQAEDFKVQVLQRRIRVPKEEGRQSTAS